MTPRFYTYPPSGREWDYILFNPSNMKTMSKLNFKHAILDSGVLIFHDPKVKDYPRDFNERWKKEAREVSDKYGEQVWITIPDLPDDYNPGQFGDNVKKTIDNIEEFVNVDRVNWLISLQARFLNIFTFAYAIQSVRELLGDYPRIAIGTVCKTNKISFIENSIKLARRHFPHSHIHAFGLTLKALPKVKMELNSFDSLAYTFPRTSGRGSCKTLAERQQYFDNYVKRIREIEEE